MNNHSTTHNTAPAFDRGFFIGFDGLFFVVGSGVWLVCGLESLRMTGLFNPPDKTLSLNVLTSP